MVTGPAHVDPIGEPGLFPDSLHGLCAWLHWQSVFAADFADLNN